MQKFGDLSVTLHNVDHSITALQTSFQYSNKLNITNETTVKQYGGVIDQHKNLIYIGNAVEFVSSEVCGYFYITIFSIILYHRGHINMVL